MCNILYINSIAKVLHVHFWTHCINLAIRFTLYLSFAKYSLSIVIS